MKGKGECVICAKEVDLLEKFNGELMCPECYNDPENQVFHEEGENE